MDQPMNWFDWLLLALLLLGALRGFSRGAIMEMTALAALVLGVLGAIHGSDRVAAWLDLTKDQHVIAFAATFIGILLVVHLIGRALTTVIDVMQLGLPNKMAGALLGFVRAVLVLSITVNVLGALPRDGWPGERTLHASLLYPRVRGIAPMLFPVLKESKWVDRALDRLRGME
ncbi:MAG: CvpA family protein [Flavobacteriales bacterium]|nr:CvpA family protein [Flavobacteriales bacterium]MCB9167036.1 CvpA family protein [Flavobacteriales bacterium]